MADNLYFTGQVNDGLDFTGDGSSSQILATGEVAVKGDKGDTGEAANHSLLTNLDADDHTQYHNDARGDDRYYVKAEVTSYLAAKAPLESPAFTGTLTTPAVVLNSDTTGIHRNDTAGTLRLSGGTVNDGANLLLTGSTASGSNVGTMRVGTTSIAFWSSARFAPSLNNTYSLGSTSQYWSNLYATTQYFNSTAYMSGATAGEIGVTGVLRTSGGIISNGVETNQVSLNSTIGIVNTSTAQLTRISGGTVNDGAVMLFGGSTHGTIANQGIARIGGTDIWRWTSAGVVPAGNGTMDNGASTNYWKYLYATRQYLNSTAYIDGGTAGQTNVASSNTFTAATTGTYGFSVTQNGTQLTMGLDASYAYIQSWSGKSLRLNSQGNAVFIGANLGIGSLSTASRVTVAGGDVEITDISKGVILKSPAGTRFRITVGDDGALTTTAV